MRTLVFALALVLAGCTAAPLPEDEAEAQGQARFTTAPVDVSVVLGGPGGCLPAFACLGYDADPETLLETPFNASISGFKLTLGAVHYLDRVPRDDPVAWAIRCRDPDTACAPDLLAGEDILPIDVDLAGLALPLGADLEIIIEATERAPLVEFLATGVIRSQVTGTVSLAWPPGVPPLELESFFVSKDGHPGPCDLAPDCSHWPGGSRWTYDVGQVVGFNLTATWDATTPADTQVELALSSSACPATCPPLQRFVGTSPLVARVPDGLAFHGITLELRPFDPSGMDLGHGGLRTPVHVEGHVFAVARDFGNGTRTAGS